MKKFQIGELEGIYEAETEQEAIEMMINDVCGAKTIDAYELYCEELGIESEIKIKEIEENYFLNKFEERFGSVECFGRKIVIVHLPYIEQDHYQSVGEDEDGNEYMIKWKITNRYAQDESDACNWEDYTVKRL